MGPGFTYYIFQQGGKDVAAMYQLMADQLKQGVPAHWMSYVAVNDADDATARRHGARSPGDECAHGRGRERPDVGDAGSAGGGVLGVAGEEPPGVAKRGEPGSLVWNELATTDIKAALTSTPDCSAGPPR